MGRRPGEKLVYGVGLNDCAFPVHQGGKANPFYACWTRMMERSYSSAAKTRAASYEESSVDERWHLYSSFAIWMQDQNWEGLHLDKDLISLGNRVYAPETCAFVPHFINTLLNIHSGRDTIFPIGVFQASANSYGAKISSVGKRKYLGSYSSPLAAHAAWQQAKFEEIHEAMIRYSYEPCYRKDVAAGLQKALEYIDADLRADVQTTTLRR